MKNILLSGPSGLIGSHLLPELSESNHVFALSRNGIQPQNNSNITAITMDLSTAWTAHSLPQEPLDTVIHLAQSEHFRDFPNAALSVFQVNTMSTLKLLDYAWRHGAKTFIYASSGGIYNAGTQLCTEDAQLTIGRDLGFYLNSKLCSEVLIESYAEQMTVIILRFFFVYGPGQRTSMLIPRLVNAVYENRPILLEGSDGLRINPTHVSDAVSCVQAAMDLNESAIINIGGPDILTLREIGNLIGQALDKKPQFENNPERVPKDLIGDIRKMSELLHPPMVSFEKGIRDYCQQTYQVALAP